MFWSKKNKHTNDYKESINAFREESKRILTNIITLDYDIKKTIDKYNNKDEVAPDIVYETLYQFPVNKIINFNEKIKSRILRKDEKEMVFESWFDKGGCVGEHYHSDFEELLEVQEGCLFDVVTGSKAKDNEALYFPSGQIHAPRAMEKTHLITTLTKI